MIGNILDSFVLFTVSSMVIYFTILTSEPKIIMEKEKINKKLCIYYTLLLSVTFTIFITILSINIDNKYKNKNKNIVRQ